MKNFCKMLGCYAQEEYCLIKTKEGAFTCTSRMLEHTLPCMYIMEDGSPKGALIQDINHPIEPIKIIAALIQCKLRIN